MFSSPRHVSHQDRSESSIVSAADSQHDANRPAIDDVLVEESSDSLVEASDGSSSDTPPPSLQTRMPSDLSSYPCHQSLALSAMRGAAEYAWQAAGRSANAVGFVLLADAAPTTLRPMAAALSALTAGYCGYRLLTAKIGNGSCVQKLAVALGTTTTAAAGGIAAAYGWATPSLAIAAGSVMTAALTGSLHERKPGTACDTAAILPALFLTTTGTSLAVLTFVPSLRMIDTDKLPRRSLALLAEAVTTEVFKGFTERSIPRVSRDGVAFERKLIVALTGLLPYALASIGFNGALGNLLRAQMRSDRFDDLLIPMLVGALANVVKGAVNSALLCRHLGDEATVQPAACPTPPDGSTLMAKTALRYVIAHARDVLYLSLVDHGINDMAAACTAYVLYAFFAQHRDLIFDLMQGDGWNEPRLTSSEQADLQ